MNHLSLFMEMITVFALLCFFGVCMYLDQTRMRNQAAYCRRLADAVSKDILASLTRIPSNTPLDDENRRLVKLRDIMERIRVNC